MLDVISKATEQMRGKITLMVGRALLTLINDAGAIQTAQARLLAGETQDDVERIQQYGFTSNPPPGSEAVIVFQGGNRDHGLIVATDNRKYRVRGLKSGELCIYTDEGDKITLKRGNLIEVETQTLRITAGAAVEIDTPAFTVTTDAARVETPLLTCTGEILDMESQGGKRMSAMRQTYNTHTHPENNTTGGSTNQPNQKM
jgi:phage baseplate assembly protein V